MYENILCILPSPGSQCFRNLKRLSVSLMYLWLVTYVELKISFLVKTGLVNHFWFRWIWSITGRKYTVYWQLDRSNRGNLQSSVGVPWLGQSSVFESQDAGPICLYISYVSAGYKHYSLFQPHRPFLLV